MIWRKKRPTAKLTLTQIALGLSERPPAPICEIRRQASLRKVNAAKLESLLRGDDLVFAFSADSLQGRLLTYLEEHLGCENVRQLFREAEKSRKKLYAQLQREALFGLHPDNKEMLPLVTGFSDYELYQLNQAIISSNRSASFKSQELFKVITTQFKAGRGENLVKYLAKRLEHQDKRLDKESPSGRWREVFHPGLTIAAGLWTAPDKPLWMMPSAGAVNIINGVLKQFGEVRVNPSNYNTFTKKKLERLPATIVSKFISVKVKDQKGLALQEEFAKVMSIKLADVRRGAQSKSPKDAIATKVKKTKPLNSKKR